MVRIARLHDAFSGILKVKASPVEGKSLQQKDKKRKTEKVQETEKPKDEILISERARAKPS